MNPIYRFYLKRPIATGNLLDPSSVVEGILQNGEINGSTSQYAGKNYIPVTATYPYSLYPLSGAATGGTIAWYNNTKGFISQTIVSSLGPQFAPSGAAFARVSFPQSWGDATFAAFGDPDTFNPYGYIQQLARPVYGDGESIDFEKESGEEFFRRKLNGALTFVKDDCDFITGAAFDTRFALDIEISYDGGENWASYWQGHFYKTDCDFKPGRVSVTPSAEDEYTKILAGMNKEFDLIKLAPAIEALTAKKRPVIQLYVPGANTLGCVFAGMYWEEQVTSPESNEAHLRNTYHFAKANDVAIATFTGGGSSFPDVLTTSPATISWDGTESSAVRTALSFVGNGVTLALTYWDEYDGEYWSRKKRWVLTQNGTTYYSATSEASISIPPTYPITGISFTGLAGVSIDVTKDSVYGRIVHGKDAIAGADVYNIPSDDIAPENLNYKKCTPYSFADMVSFYSGLSSTPTQFGLYDSTQYYAAPYTQGIDYMPIARSSWERISIWYNGSAGFDQTLEEYASVEFTFRDCYPLFGVISALLGEIDPSLTFEGNSAFSAFLYGTTALRSDGTSPYLIPKSNVIKGEYDSPAMQAPITLRSVLDMLRDCFRCYWFIEDGKLRIEHIKFFMNGGSYSVAPSVGIDLTEMMQPRAGKPWAFGQDDYKFNKPEMPERYEFAWMDKQTDPFNGNPIEIQSGYVEQGNIKRIALTDFSSDLDYILLNPSDISEDGFVLVMASGGAIPEAAVLFSDDNLMLQNPYASFAYLQRFYLYDLPAPEFSIGGRGGTALGTQRHKESEAIFPAITDPDMKKLVKTNIGNGQIQKIDLTLQGRTAKATLRYDTE